MVQTTDSTDGQGSPRQPARSTGSARRPRLSSGALRRLDVALRLAATGDAGGLAELHEAVREQVVHLREQGEPADRVVAEIKREIQEAQTRIGSARTEDPTARALAEQVVRWCRDAYHRGD